MKPPALCSCIAEVDVIALSRSDSHKTLRAGDLQADTEKIDRVRVMRAWADYHRTL